MLKTKGLKFIFLEHQRFQKQNKTLRLKLKFIENY